MIRFFSYHASIFSLKWPEPDLLGRFRIGTHLNRSERAEIRGSVRNLKPCVFYIDKSPVLKSGFHKIGTDKWEFANEDFLRGQRALLKHITRRRSSQAHQFSTQIMNPSSLDIVDVKSGVENEVDKLKKEKEMLMQELIQLRQENLGTVQKLDSLNNRMQSAEARQKQMVSFLAKVLQNPTFIGHLKKLKDERGMLSSMRVKRKFLKHSSSFSSSSNSTLNYAAESNEGNQIEIPDHLLKDIADKLEIDTSGECSQYMKGKNILMEPDIVDSIVSVEDDEYLMSLPENIINLEIPTEENISGKMVFPEVIVPVNNDRCSEGVWENIGVDVGGNVLLSDNAAWDINIGDYNAQDSLWDNIGLSGAEEDLDIDKYFSRESLVQDGNKDDGTQLNREPEP